MKDQWEQDDWDRTWGMVKRDLFWLAKLLIPVFIITMILFKVI